MKLTQHSLQKLERYRPYLEQTGIKWKIWIVSLLIVVAIGLFGLYKQIVDGHIVTGMRDHVVWGLYIANFIFFIGLSYAGAIIGALFYLFKVPWRRIVIRIAAMITLGGAIVGPIFIILCIGRFDRLHYLLLYPRLQSPIIWDVVAISSYIVAAFIFMYLVFIKDFAVYRDFPSLNVSNWRKKLYKFLAINYEGLESQDRQIHISSNLISLILVPMVIIISSILSWIFGMTLRPGWHSTIFGPYFVLAAIYSGVGAIIITMWVFRRLYNLQDSIKDKHFRYMGYIMLTFAAAYGYFTFSEYLTGWYASGKWESEVIEKLLDPASYGNWFVLSNIFGILFPIFVIAIRKLRTPAWITLASVLMIISMWVKRYLIVVPTLETPLLPIQDLRPEYTTYIPTWVEWALTFGGLASFLLVVSLVAKFVFIVPMTDLKDKTSRISNVGDL